MRTAYLNENGYRVLRFWNHDVLKNIEGVLQIIVAAIKPPPTPAPLSASSRRGPPAGRREGS